MKKILAWIKENPLLPIFTVALLLRVLIIFIIPKYPDNEPGYIASGFRVLTELGYGYWRVIPGDGLYWRSWVIPLYSYIQAFFTLFVGMNYFHIRLCTVAVFIVTGAIGCVLTYYTARNLGLSHKLALIGAWIMATLPSQCLWSTRLHPHTILNFMLILILFLVTKDYVKHSPIYLLLAGLSLAVTALARAEAASLWVPFFIWWAFQSKKRLFFKRVILFTVGFFSLYSFWLVRNWNIHHKLILSATNMGENVIFSHNVTYDPKDPFLHGGLYFHAYTKELKEMKTEYEVNKFFTKEGIRYCIERPGVFIKTTLYHLWHFWRPYLTPRAVPWTWNLIYTAMALPFLIFYFIGLWKNLSPRNPIFIAWFMVMWHCAVHLPFYMLIRYRENVFFFILLTALVGFQSVTKKWAKLDKFLNISP